jgi:hypothetical protein
MLMAGPALPVLEVWEEMLEETWSVRSWVWTLREMGTGTVRVPLGRCFGKRVDVVDVGGRNDSELLVTCVFGKIEVGMAEVDCWFSAS